MKGLKIITGSVAGVWLFATVMVFFFPRQRYQGLSTVFAILFWISLILLGVFAYLLISSLKQQKTRKKKVRGAPPDYLSAAPVNEDSFNPPDGNVGDGENKTPPGASAAEQNHSEVEK